ncbi:E3 ubiquitin-protein ligase TRIM11, partial [Ophiophagus hannah]
MLALGDSHLIHVRGLQSVKECWEALLSERNCGQGGAETAGEETRKGRRKHSAQTIIYKDATRVLLVSTSKGTALREGTTEQCNKGEGLFSTCASMAKHTRSTWLLDSGASHHIANNPQAFFGLQQAMQLWVSLADGQRAAVKEEGKEGGWEKSEKISHGLIIQEGKNTLFTTRNQVGPLAEIMKLHQWLKCWTEPAIKASAGHGFAAFSFLHFKIKSFCNSSGPAPSFSHPHNTGNKGGILRKTKDLMALRPSSGHLLGSPTVGIEGAFDPTLFYLVNRHDFYIRSQREEESINEFVAAVQRLSKNCKFGNAEDIIRDQLVLDLRDLTLQKRLLTREEVSFKEALKEARAMEISDSSTAQIKGNGKVHATQAERSSEKDKEDMHREPSCEEAAEGIIPGLPAVLKRPFAGNARGKATSRQTDRQNRRAYSPTRHHNQYKGKKHPGVKFKKQDGTQEEETHYTTLGYARRQVRHTAAFETNKVRINGTLCQMEVDSGSYISMISWTALPKINPRITWNQLQLQRIILKDYKGCKISPTREERAHPITDQPHWHPHNKREFQEVISSELGKYKGTPISFNLDPNIAPVRLKSLRVPFALWPKIEEQLDKLVAQGVFELVNHARWETPIVTPVKPDGLQSAYPVPVVQYLLHSLGRGKVFAKLDLAQAYKQLPVETETTEAQIILMHRVKTVLECFQETGLRLKKDKCHIAILQVVFLGFLIDGSGIQPTSSKLRTNKEAPTLQSKTELQRSHSAGCSIKTPFGLGSPARMNRQIDKKALAAIARVKRFHEYLYGRPFELITNHKPLLGIPSGNRPTPNILRCPLPDLVEDPAPATSMLLSESLKPSLLTSADIARLTAKDRTLVWVLNWVWRGWQDKTKGDEFMLFKHRQLELSALKGCLLWGERVVIPQPLRKRVLEMLYEGHPGIDIETWVATCPPCQESRPAPPAATPSSNGRSHRHQNLHVDFAEPYPGQTLLLVVDTYSKWLEVVIMKSTTNEATIKALRTTFTPGDQVYAHNYMGWETWVLAKIIESTRPRSYRLEVEGMKIWNRHIDQLQTSTCTDAQPVCRGGVVFWLLFTALPGPEVAPLLGSGHSCLSPHPLPNRANGALQLGDEVSCPQCRAMVEPSSAFSNQALANMVCLVKRLQLPEGAQEGSNSQRLCQKHRQPLQIFCSSEKSLLCPGCLGGHQGHPLLSLPRAAQEYKDLLDGLLESLRKEEQKLLHQRQAEEQSRQECQEQFATEKQQVGLALQSLQELLQESQLVWLGWLAEQEEKMEAEWGVALAQLSGEASCLQQLMAQTKRKQVPELPGGARRECLSQAARQTLDPLGEKHFFKVDCGQLQSFSADNSDQGEPGATSDHGTCCRTAKALLNVTWANRYQNCPDVPGRIHHRMALVSMQGPYNFPVRGTVSWAIGVAKESIPRKGSLQLSPQEGIWALGKSVWEQTVAFEPNLQKRRLQSPLQRLWVRLDCEAKEVQFLDAVTETSLYTFQMGPILGEIHQPFFFLGKMGLTPLRPHLARGPDVVSPPRTMPDHLNILPCTSFMAGGLRLTERLWSCDTVMPPGPSEPPFEVPLVWAKPSMPPPARLQLPEFPASRATWGIWVLEVSASSRCCQGWASLPYSVAHSLDESVELLGTPAQQSPTGLWELSRRFNGWSLEQQWTHPHRPQPQEQMNHTGPVAHTEAPPTCVTTSAKQIVIANAKNEDCVGEFPRSGLKLKKDKCHIAILQVEFLGFLIDGSGIRPTSSKLRAIKEAPTPQSKTELQWSRSTDCSIKTPFGLGGSRGCSYSETLLLSLTYDTSPYGIRAVLSPRLPNRKEAPKAYYSKTLSKAEKNYRQIDKEALATITRLKRFHEYLYGRPFELITNHKPLMGILSGNRPTPNILRCPLPDLVEDPAPATSVLLSESLKPSLLTSADITRLTAKDRTLVRVLNWVWRGWQDKTKGDEFTLFKHRQLELVVIPQPLRKRVLEMLYEGHPGIVQMKALARSYIWWPGLDKDIETWQPLLKWEKPSAPKSTCKFCRTLPRANTLTGALRKLFTTHGLPDVLVSDNGPQFTAQQFKGFLVKLGICHVLSTLAHLAMNGQAERMCRTFTPGDQVYAHNYMGGVTWVLAKIIESTGPRSYRLETSCGGHITQPPHEAEQQKTPPVINKPRELEMPLRPLLASSIPSRVVGNLALGGEVQCSTSGDTSSTESTTPLGTFKVVPWAESGVAADLPTQAKTSGTNELCRPSRTHRSPAYLHDYVCQTDCDWLA